MRRLTVVRPNKNVRIAIGGLIAVVVMAILAITTMNSNIVRGRRHPSASPVGAVPVQQCRPWPQTAKPYWESRTASAEVVPRSTGRRARSITALGRHPPWSRVAPVVVTIIKLQKRNLDGSIPADIGKIEKLVDLWLYVNSLTGPQSLRN